MSLQSIAPRTFFASDLHFGHANVIKHCNRPFEDFYEHSFTTYTHSFRWCCMALTWGIAKYDAWKDEQAKAAAKKDAFDSLPDDYEVN